MDLRSIGIPLLVLAANGPAQSTRVLTRVDEAPFILRLGQFAPRPLWSGHTLLAVEIPRSRELILHSTIANGESEEIRFSMPEWGELTVAGVWGGEDGQIILAGSGQPEEGDRAGFIGWIGADHKSRKIVKVPDYALQVVTVGPGGVIWAIGASIEKPPREKPPRPNILLRFSPKGKLLTDATLNVRPGNVPDVTHLSWLRASADRVAWLTTANQYLEFDASGTEINRLDGPQPQLRNDLWTETLAISPANSVVITLVNRQGRKYRLDMWSLDRLKHTWFRSDPAEGAFPAGTRIYGFDGEDLMTSGYKPNMGQLLVRYRPSE